VDGSDLGSHAGVEVGDKGVASDDRYRQGATASSFSPLNIHRQGVISGDGLWAKCLCSQNIDVGDKIHEDSG